MRFSLAAALALSGILPFAAGCHHAAPRPAPQPTGTIQGVIAFSGPIPKPTASDLAQARACAELQKRYRHHHHPRHIQDRMLPRSLPPVFVWISTGLKNPTPAPPRRQTVLTQLNCRFHPQLLGVLAGQPVDFANNDPFPTHFHIAASAPGNPSFELSLPPQKPGQVRSFPHPELMIPVTSPDRHSMHAYINVVSNPFFTVSGPQGHFLIGGLSPGVYTLSAIRPGHAVQSQTITVKANAVAQTSFTFPAASSPPPGNGK